MKQIFSLLMIVMLSLSLCSCTEEKNMITSNESSADTGSKVSETTNLSATECIHDYSEATCTSPKICIKCEATEGSSKGHMWKEATCIVSKTCSVCGVTEGSTIEHNYQNGHCTMCYDASDIVVSKIWMNEPGKALKVGDSVTFYIEATFKYSSGSFVLWFKSCDNENSIKSAVVTNSSTSDDNVYCVSLEVSEDMFPGKWIANWYYISDKYNTYETKDFTEQDCENLWFIVNE